MVVVSVGQKQIKKNSRKIGMDIQSKNSVAILAWAIPSFAGVIMTNNYYLWNAIFLRSSNHEAHAEFYARSDMEETYHISGETKEALFANCVSFVVDHYQVQLNWEKECHQGELLDTFDLLGAFGPEGIVPFNIEEQPKVINIKQLWQHERFMRMREYNRYALSYHSVAFQTLYENRPDLYKIYEEAEFEEKKQIKTKVEEKERARLAQLLKKYPDVKAD